MKHWYVMFLINEISTKRREAEVFQNKDGEDVVRFNVKLKMGKSEAEKPPSSKTKKERLLYPTKVFI